jgi:hypothetical protein
MFAGTPSITTASSRVGAHATRLPLCARKSLAAKTPTASIAAASSRALTIDRAFFPLPAIQNPLLAAISAQRGPFEASLGRAIIGWPAAESFAKPEKFS